MEPPRVKVLVEGEAAERHKNFIQNNRIYGQNLLLTKQNFRQLLPTMISLY
jgi:hypothetical protein